MKKIIIIMLLALVSLGTVPVWAQTENEVEVRTVKPAISPLQRLRNLVNSKKDVRLEAREELREIKEERKEDLKELRTTLASSTQKSKEERNRIASTTGAKMTTALNNRLSKNLQNMIERFEATIEREEAIMSKINSRIEKIKALGGQTTEGEKLVAEAKVHLTEAKTAMEKLEALAEGMMTETTASSTKELAKNTLKNAGNEVEKHLREAHKALEKTIGALRGVSQLQNASSTKEN